MASPLSRGSAPLVSSEGTSLSRSGFRVVLKVVGKHVLKAAGEALETQMKPTDTHIAVASTPLMYEIRKLRGL